ncbi:MAG: tetratricopeptide repeat protein, partial [Armatimonadetes bacterium]|nr:tetratricopeptide repeat protein [Armatimonadota bacterium]
EYARAAELSPDDSWAQYNLGVALEAAGRQAEAEAAFEQGLGVGGDDAELCAAVARAFTSHGRSPEAAVQVARRACGIDPDSADAFDALAMALYSAGRYREALTPSQEAIRLDSEAAEYVYDLGVIQDTTGDAAGARLSFTRALELAPDFEEAREKLRRLEGGF